MQAVYASYPPCSLPQYKVKIYIAVERRQTYTERRENPGVQIVNVPKFLRQIFEKEWFMLSRGY
jgi:hypothetical protein